MQPYFSIILATYNRPNLVMRAIRSCLAQDGDDYEVIVVDDGSTDDTPQVLGAIDDPRVRFIRHERNMGVGQARQTAAEAARGEWCVRLDSDEEFLPDALASLREELPSLPDDVGVVFLMYRTDDGGVSPDPPLVEGYADYEQFIDWCATVSLSKRKDCVGCYRRSTWMSIEHPMSGSGLPMLHNLDFAKVCRFRFSGRFVGLFHDDATDRLTQPQTIGKFLKIGRDRADYGCQIMERHGAAALRHNLATYGMFAYNAAYYNLLAGRRGPGIRYMLQCLRHQPRVWRYWALLILGTISPRLLAWALLQVKRRLRKSPAAGGAGA